MPVVKVSINGQDYQVACEEGQEAHLGNMADYVDKTGWHNSLKSWAKSVRLG